MKNIRPFMRTLERTVLFLFLLCSPSLLRAQELSSETPEVPPSSWGHYVQEFRRNHHFVYGFAGTSGRWEYRHFGDKKHYTTKGLASKFEYSFRIPFAQKFGYLLGSSVGIQYEEAIDTPAFNVGTVLRLPGVLGGLIWNPSPQVSLLLTLESYLERIHGFRETSADRPVYLRTSMYALYDVGAAVEIYSRVFWGVRMEYHRREVRYAPPENARDRVEDIQMRRYDNWLGFGVVYHLL